MEGAFRDRRTLRAIAATLLALALLAERAAGRSFPVRFLVLSLLWRAEAVARAFVAEATGTFVAGATGADWPCPDLPSFAEPLGLRGRPVDAAILALRLRMLAAVLGMLSGAAGLSAGEEPRPEGAPGLPVILVVRLPAARRPPRPHDTS